MKGGALLRGGEARTRADIAIAAGLFAVALSIGTWYVPRVVAAGGQPRFYQESYGTAVMLACGHGYVNPDAATLEDLRQFLSLERDRIECSESLARIERRPLVPMQTAYRYLMTAVAWTWRLRGKIAWSSLAPLYGLFYAVTVVLAFAVFRQGMGRVLAVVITCALASSPLHLSYLAHLRDYSKAPFVLGLVLLAMKLVRPPLSFRRALTLAAEAGILTGIGMGFRNDLLVAVPAFVGALLLFLPADQIARGWRNLAAAGVFLATFALAISPMWSIYRTGGGSSSQHLIVLGLGEPFGEELGVENGHLYEWGYGYSDEFAHAMISAHATRRLGNDSFLKMYGPDYDRAATDYLRHVAANFPADLVTRAYASTIKILELPYDAKLFLPHDQFIQLPRRFVVARDRVVRQFTPVWPWAIGFMLVSVSLSSPRLGLFAVALLFYLSGYPALQFNERHYFHLEFVGWWALGFSASLTWTALTLAAGGRLSELRPAIGWRGAITQALVLWVVVAVMLVAPLWALRAYQQPHLRQLFQKYVNAPVESLPLTPTIRGNGWVSIESPPQVDAVKTALQKDGVHAELIVAEFGGAACDSLKLDAVFRYTSTERAFDFTRTLQVQPPLSSTPLRILIPVYFHKAAASQAAGAMPGRTDYALAALDLPSVAAGCLTKLARVRDTSSLPLLLELQLPPKWEQATLYETIAAIESRSNGDEVPAVYTFPSDLAVGRALLMQPLAQLQPGDIAKRSPTLETTSGAWRNTGVGGVGGKGPFLYLFETKQRRARQGDIALIQGRIERGGVSFGLVGHGGWVAQASVAHSGEFTIVVRAPDDGDYSLVLANNLPAASWRNDVLIRRVGWVRAPAAGR